MVLGWVLGLVFPPERVSGEAAGMVGRYLLPFVSASLMAAPLAYPIGRSPLRGSALLGAVFLAVFGLMTVLTQIEAALLLNLSRGELWRGIPLQIIRGALFVAFVLPLLRSMSVTRRQASLALAVMIPLVHGVAALIPPNPFMPAFVRHAHMIEIGWSNFVLGLLIGFLFWNPGPSEERRSFPGGSQWK